MNSNRCHTHESCHFTSSTPPSPNIASGQRIVMHLLGARVLLNLLNFLDCINIGNCLSIRPGANFTLLLAIAIWLCSQRLWQREFSLSLFFWSEFLINPKVVHNFLRLHHFYLKTALVEKVVILLVFEGIHGEQLVVKLREKVLLDCRPAVEEHVFPHFLA